jgi:site-specific recombinase XerD
MAQESYQSFDSIKKANIEKSIKAILGGKEYSKKNKEILLRFHDKVCIDYPRLTTRKSYLQALRCLMLDIKKDLDTITREDIQKYLVLLSGKFKTKTILERKKFLYVFFTWFKDQSKEKLREELLKDVKIKKEAQDVINKDVLTVKEIQKMIQVAKTFRDKAVISLLYETGSRKGEFLQLKVKDIELTEYGAKVKIPQGKTNSRINILIDSVPDIKAWFESHPERDNPNAPLFVTEGAWLRRALGEDGLKRVVKECAKRAKIKKKVYPHLFRHSKATEFARAGKNEDFLRKWFGWSKSSKTPTLYVNTNVQDMERQYKEMKGIKGAIEESNEESEVLKPKVCPRCKEKDIPSHFKFCPKCSQVLDRETALKLFEKETLEKELQNELLAQSLKKKDITKGSTIQDVMFEVLKNDKRLIAKLKEIVA